MKDTNTDTTTHELWLYYTISQLKYDINMDPVGTGMSRLSHDRLDIPVQSLMMHLN